ncbi:MAG: DUF308 domain-containing protein [Lachnospiraceae bacterium]|nr:DUF308 domain-containing protein [Lachnospiraceae bacterium]
MKEIREFKKSYILVSALYVVLGAVLLFWPDVSVQMICYVLGFAMIVIGITYGIIYFTKDNLSGVLQMDLVIGIVAVAFGIFILLNQAFLASVLPFAMGIILLLGAVVKLQNAINMKRLKFGRWYVVLIFALLLVGLGIVLLVNPFRSEYWMVLYIGGCLVLDGLVNLVSMAFIVSRFKKLMKLQRENPDRVVDPSELISPKKQENTGVVKYQNEK